jgi:integrase
MARTRADGEGTITKRADGRWQGRLSLGVGPDGQRRRLSLYGRTRIEVVDKMRAARTRVADGLPPTDSAGTVGAYLRWWAESILPGTVRETTAYGYWRLIETHLLPRIGHHRLGRLAPAHVHDMLRDLEAEGRGPNTRRNVRAVLRRALAHAERWGLVPRNVAALVDAPRGTTKTDDALDLEGVKQLIAGAEGDRLEALWLIAVTVGLRKGEALALTWNDVNLNAAEVTVRGTLRRLPGRGLTVNAPKSERGARTVALPSIAVEALRRRRQTQRLERMAVKHWTDTGYVFTTEVGTPIDPDNLQRAWRKLTARAGLGVLRFHALRHTAATLALDRGVPLEVISRQLGHAGYAITADVYAHVGRSAQRDAADAMQAVLE